MDFLPLNHITFPSLLKAMSNKEKVILVAHGSRKKEANEEILTLSKKLNAKMAKQGVVVCAAFLEMAKPSIEDEVKQAAKEGFQSYFFLALSSLFGFSSAKRHPFHGREA